MNKESTLDPFERLPFFAYLDPQTGQQEHYQSLAQFIHAERLRGADDNYRDYLIRVDDAEILRLEVDGVDITGSGREDWADLQDRIVGAGIYMQALSNRTRYQGFADNIESLSITGSSFSNSIAVEMGRFIESLGSEEPKLKVLFLGAPKSQEFAVECFDSLFAKRMPLCIYGLEDDSCAQQASDYSRAKGIPFAQFPSANAEDALIENIQLRCSHVFMFVDGGQSDFASRLQVRLEGTGTNVHTIQQA